MQAEPQAEHQWLHRLVGEWTCEMTCDMGPDKTAMPPMKGTERARMVGGLWVVAEGRSEMPGGGTGTTLLSLGYDPHKRRYVGTWLGSMMANLWVYDGSLDAAGRVLTLNTEGPSFTADGETTGAIGKYKDVITFETDDHRVLASHALGADGQWRHFMTAHYRRAR